MLVVSRLAEYDEIRDFSICNSNLAIVVSDSCAATHCASFRRQALDYSKSDQGLLPLPAGSVRHAGASNPRSSCQS